MNSDSITSGTVRKLGTATVVSALEALTAGVAIAGVCVLAAGLRVASSMESWVFLCLAGKPIIDLTWRWRLFELAAQRVNPQSVIGLVVPALTFAAFLQRRRECANSKPVVAFLLLATISVAVNFSPEGVNELLRLFAGVSFYFVAGAVLHDEQRFDRFCRWFVATVSIPVLLCYLQIAGTAPFEYWDWIDGEAVGRVSGTYQHPLGVIFFLLYAIPIALYLGDKYRNVPRIRWLAVLFIGVTLGAIVFTYDRTAYVALAIQFVLWFAIRGRFSRRYLIAGGVFLVGAAVLGSAWLATLYSARVIGVWGPDFLRGRGANWIVFMSSLYGGGPVAWLIGRGASVASGFVPGLGFYTSDEPHDDFIRLMHAYGIIGLALYLMILVRIVREALLLRRKGSEYQRGLGAIALLVVPSILLFSVTTEPMRYPTGIWYLFALASIVQVNADRIAGWRTRRSR
ncbi:MAG: O-antigen ligase family protein [Acidobacteriia bacterium]|nr:O-antigen ligase family protein [Terriglobia bacterium]